MNNLRPNQFGLQATIADIAASGEIALPVVSGVQTIIDQYRQIDLNQATADIVLTLPDLADTSTKMKVGVTNTGTADVTMYGVKLTPNTGADFYWDTDKWMPDVGPSGLTPQPETLNPTAQNTLPALANAVQAGTTPLVFVNGHNESPAFTITAATGAVAYDPAISTHNIEPDIDEVIVYYVAAI